MSANALGYKGLKISPSIKHEVISKDDGELLVTEIEMITRFPIGFHSEGLRNIRYEGLGVNHEEWQKKKAEQSN